MSQATGRNMPSVTLIRASELLEGEVEIAAMFLHGLVPGWPPGPDVSAVGCRSRSWRLCPPADTRRPRSRSTMTLVQGGLSVHPVHLCHLCYTPSSSSPFLRGSGVAAPCGHMKESDPTAGTDTSSRTSRVARGPCCNSGTGDEDNNFPYSFLCHRYRSKIAGWGLGKSPFSIPSSPCPAQT